MNEEPSSLAHYTVPDVCVMKVLKSTQLSRPSERMSALRKMVLSSHVSSTYGTQQARISWVLYVDASQFDWH